MRRTTAITRKMEAMLHNLTGHIAAAVGLIALTLAFSTPVPAQSGAIFTTDANGATVNGNIYQSKADVYLDGGPPPTAPCTSAGLDDGDYYFQVTNPSASQLLSSDAISERKVTVFGGVITAYVGTTHSTGTGKCVPTPANISVGLFPFNDTDNPGCEYKVWMTPVTSYQVDGNGVPAANTFFGFQPAASKTDNFKVCTTTPSTSTISGIKFYDTNADGVQDPGEGGIQGWQIFLAGPASTTNTTTVSTNTAGAFSFVNLSDGTYGVCEIIPAGQPQWVPTTATSRSGIVVPPGSTDTKFGNVCLGGGGGLTLGFWTNKNGQYILTGSKTATTMAASYGTLLNSLNLRNANGSNFDPGTNYTAFRSWLLSATATNMAYMLSAQLATMELNVASGGVLGTAMIYAPGANNANTAGFATVKAVMDEANTELGLHGSTLSGSPYRSYQQDLKNALDQANNNNNFVQAAGTCAVNYNNTETCAVTP